MNLLDRQLIRNFLKAYLGCLVCLLSLFIVVDLFTHLDDFAQKGKDAGRILGHIGKYYLNMMALIFDRLSEAIVLLAAMFTVALVQRNNELLPLLSAGISTRRVFRPVLFSAFAMLTLSSLNQELVLPKVDSFLLENRSDPEGEKPTGVSGGYEANNIHITGGVAFKKEKLIKDFFCTIPQSLTRDSLIALKAKEARYIPPGNSKRSGGWRLEGVTTQPADIHHWPSEDILEKIIPGQVYFLYTQDVDFERATRNKNWKTYMSTLLIWRELGKPASNRLAQVAVIFHMRLTRPFLGMILVLLGLSVILRDQNRNIFISAGLCLVLCGVFFVVCFACKSLGDNNFLAPAMAAWLPVLVFGPFSFVMFDAVHT